MGIFRWLWKNTPGANPFVDDTEDELGEASQTKAPLLEGEN